MVDASLWKAFDEEMTALAQSGATMPYRFTPGDAFLLLCVMQHTAQSRAIRNGFSDVAYFAEKLGREIQERLCKTPAMREVASQGWNRLKEPEPAPAAMPARFDPEPEEALPPPPEPPKKKRKK